MRLVETVDRDGAIGQLVPVMEAHQAATAHRAISIIVWNLDRTRMLITRRAAAKTTWPGFWSNAVCSHPLPREPYVAAARRRLYEELRLRDSVELAFHMFYGPVRCPVSRMFEHELDYVFYARVSERASIKPNRAEISALRWVGPEQVAALQQTGKLTPWFAMILARLRWGR